MILSDWNIWYGGIYKNWKRWKQFYQRIKRASQVRNWAEFQGWFHSKVLFQIVLPVWNLNLILIEFSYQLSELIYLIKNKILEIYLYYYHYYLIPISKCRNDNFSCWHVFFYIYIHFILILWKCPSWEVISISQSFISLLMKLNDRSIYIYLFILWNIIKKNSTCCPWN